MPQFDNIPLTTSSSDSDTNLIYDESAGVVRQITEANKNNLGTLADGKVLKHRTGTTVQHSTFVGQNGELTVDTDKKTLVVHDGVTAGGFPSDYTVNVMRFGAKGDGVTDDTAAIQAAINAAYTGDASATPRGSRVRLPAGNYKFSSLVLKPGVYLDGDAPDLTILTHTATTGNAISFDASLYTANGVYFKVGLRNLSVHQSGAATAGCGFYCYQGQPTLEHVWFFNTYVGMSLNGVIFPNCVDVQAFYTRSHGHIIIGATGGSFSACYSSSNGISVSTSYGFYVNACAYCSFNACGVDVSPHAGYWVQNCTGCGFYGCGNEACKYGAYCYSAHGCTFSAFYTHVGSTTVNAAVLDGCDFVVLDNLSANLDGVTVGVATYMISNINTSTHCRVFIGTVSGGSWPSGRINDTTGIDDYNDGAGNRTIRQTAMNMAVSALNVNTTLNARYITLNGGALPAIDGGSSLANAARIIALYNYVNIFSGLGMDPSSVGVRVAGDLASTIADLGAYSQDGAYTWTSFLKLSNALLTLKPGVAVKLNLPTSPGASGTLYSNSGVVTVSP